MNKYLLIVTQNLTWIFYIMAVICMHYIPQLFGAQLFMLLLFTIPCEVLDFTGVHTRFFLWLYSVWIIVYHPWWLWSLLAIPGFVLTVIPNYIIMDALVCFYVRLYEYLSILQPRYLCVQHSKYTVEEQWMRYYHSWCSCTYFERSSVGAQGILKNVVDIIELNMARDYFYIGLDLRNKHAPLRNFVRSGVIAQAHNDYICDVYSYCEALPLYADIILIVTSYLDESSYICDSSMGDGLGDTYMASVTFLQANTLSDFMPRWDRVKMWTWDKPIMWAKKMYIGLSNIHNRAEYFIDWNVKKQNIDIMYIMEAQKFMLLLDVYLKSD